MIGIIISVGIRTNSSMKEQMREESEFLLANVVERLGDNTKFDDGFDKAIDIDMYQIIMEDLASNDEVLYAGFLDKNYKFIAIDDPSYIGTDMSDDANVVESISQNKIFSSDSGFDGNGVFDMIYPVIIEGESLGALKIAFTLDDVNAAIKDNIFSIATIGLIVIAILSFTLYKTSNMIITIINSLREDSEMMARGDFSRDVPEEMLALENEFGEIARAIMTMKKSVRNILSGVINSTDMVA